MDLNKLMREAQKMQSEMKKKQEELESTLFEVETNGGAINVSIMGNYHVEKIEIDKDLIDPEDKEMLEDMLLVAMNEAIEAVNEEASQITASLPKGMPGF